MIPTTPNIVIRFGSGAIFTDSFTLGTNQGVLGVNVLGVQTAVQVPNAQQISIRRGRSTLDSTFGAGTCTVRFLDFTGDWNPQNSGGPYFGQLVPGRQLQIQTTLNNVGRNLYAGYITAWDWDWSPAVEHAVVTVTASDTVRQFQLAEVTTVPGTAAGDLPGQRINAVLDAVSWPQTARNITDGTVTLQDDPGDRRTLLAALQTVEASDLGALFVDVNGRVTYLSRVELATRAVSQAAVFDETGNNLSYRNISVELSDDQIINTATVTPEGLTPQTAQDTASRTKYFPRAVDRSRLLMETETRALQQAEAIVAARAEPGLTLKRIEFDVLDTATLAAVVDLDIGDPVDVTKSYVTGDVQFRSIIQGLSWDITPDKWRGRIETADTIALTNTFVLGSTQFGVLGVNTLG